MNDDHHDVAGESDGAAGASGEDRLAAPPDDSRPPRLPFPVVGVGASAGGLEAYTELLRALPAKNGMALVLVQHLAPDRESLVAEILARHTPLPVLQVADGQAVEPNHVYVIRPGFTLTIRDGRLHLGEVLEARGHSRPVDDFFRSLAAEQQQRAVAVVLSGMGSNGSAGAEAVKAVGGVCIAQDPESAGFPSMPRNVIDANLADFILRPAEIPAVLMRYAAHSYAAGAKSPEQVARREAQAVNEVLTVLHARTRHDFHGYRKPTLVRRIQRRMGLNHVESMPEYVRTLRQNTAEATALADDLLIHVTGFFRDPPAWDALHRKAIVPLVAARPAGAEVRAWVSACATGEEAYSLAMLLVETAEAAGKPLDIKVFATDMAERALGHARTGVFPGGIESEVTPERLARFFDRDDTVYRVKKELRELIVFAPQNVLQDPPFSRLDVVTCRNLLIYLEPEVQKRVLALFHFGLRDGGTLMLGSSETVSGPDPGFEPVDKKHRLYRRVGPTRHRALEFPLPELRLREALENRGVGRHPPRTAVGHVVNRMLLDHYTPAAVVADRNGQIVHYHGNTNRFLEQPRGEPTRDLFALATDQVRGAVRTALTQAAEQNRSVAVRDGLIDTPAGRRRVEVRAAPLVDPRPDPALYLVVFTDHPEAPAPPPADGQPADPTPVEELRRVREELQSTIEELQTSNEEMKASHEEVVSINEELQSANEELETSKEELQSLNEELTTVNALLQAKMDELEATTNDLGSLLSSTDIGVVFLDLKFRIRRFTPAVKDLIDLIPSDVGRPLADLRRKFTDPDLIPDAQAVLDRLVPITRDVQSESGRWYLRRALAYRTADNRIDGVVVTFVDTTDQRTAQEALRASEERFRLLVENVQDYALIFLDAGGRVASWNAGAERLLGYRAEEVLGGHTDRFFIPEDQARGLPHNELKVADTHGHAEDENWLARKDGTRFWASGATTAIRDEAGGVRGYVKIFRDLTERRVAEAALRDGRERLRLALTAARMGIWHWDVAADTHTRDENLNRLLGLPPVETSQPFAEFLTHVHPDDRDTVTTAFDQSVKHGSNLNVEFRVVRPDGAVRWLRDQGDVFNATGDAPYMTGACVDVTALKDAEAALRQARDELEARVQQRTAELGRVVEELRVESSERREAQDARREMLGRLVTGQEEERRRIARELHDSLGQYLAAMTIGLRAVQEKVGGDPPARARLERLFEMTKEVGQEVHRLALELRPTALDDVGLGETLRAYVDRWAERSHVAAEFAARGMDGEQFPWEISTAAYRAVQEALTNVLKHAGATRVSVIVERQPDHLLAVVEDDGRGFDADARPKTPRGAGGLGLLGMRERVALVGGTLQIESTPGGGTTVFVRIPVPPAPDGE